MEWTKEQEAAVYGEKTNCLVSAAAGSGKTQVLTGRIINRILSDGIDIDRILVVTFTKAAAAEMRERISKSLTEALGNEPENAHLLRQVSSMDSATITTMDAFCLKLLRTYFLEAQVDAAFRVADATEVALLRIDAAQMALEEMYERREPNFIDFANSYSHMKDDSVLCDMAISFYNFAESMPNPTAWISEQAKRYQVDTEEDFLKSLYAKTILENVKQNLRDLAKRLQEAEKDFSASASFSAAFSEDAKAILHLTTLSDWDALQEEMQVFTWCKRKKEPDKALAEMADAVRKEIKKQAEDIFDSIPYSAELSAKVMKDSFPHIAALCELTLTFHKLYTEKKKEKNILDYSDLEHKAIELLTTETEEGYVPSRIAKELQEQYDEIYIDEYQDSNDVQELLFTSISGEREGKPNMFMVGDMKQSIYGFRKTSPALFIQKNDTYGKDEQSRKVTLSKNFRSREEILDFVNVIFEQLMQKEVGGIAYTAEERLYAGAAYPPPKAMPIEIDIAEEDGSASEKLVAEAALIAEKIEEAVKGQVYDIRNGIWRDARYSDIAVIMRSAKDMASPLEAACAKRGIPIYSDMGGGYFETVEVSIFLSLLQTIDNPQNDIPLLATLRAPFFGFTEEELAQIRLFDRKNLYYTALQKASKAQTPLGEKCRQFLKKLRAWRRRAAFLPTDTLIMQLFTETGYLLFVSGLPGGAMKRGNLELLFEKAHQFEKTSFRGLFHFLQYVERLSSRGDDVGEAKLIGENENVVRLMSIHKSKGLEFPVVILAGTARKFNKKNLQGNILFHKTLGIGLSNIEPKRRIKYDTPAKTAVQLLRSGEERGEELRVLYVALTRAKERLIITGASSEIELEKKKRGGLSPSEILAADSFLTLLLRAARKTGVPIKLCSVEPMAEKTSSFASIPKPKKPQEKVRGILEYQYTRPDLRDIPSKISVSEYKRLFQQNEAISFPLYKPVDLHTPRFSAEETKIQGASLGSLLHFVMQIFPYESVHTREEIRNFVHSLAAQKIITPLQAEAVDIEKLYAFWAGEMGQRIRRADKVYRETPFTQMVPAALLTGQSAHADEKIIMQGVIDCYFFEGDRLVLLDYKTDSVTDEKVISERYKLQMECYAMALRQKYFSEIYQKVIYLFSNNGIIIVNE